MMPLEIPESTENALPSWGKNAPRRVLNQFNSALAEYQNSFAETWHDTAHTPPQRVDALGKNATLLFSAHAAAGQYLAHLAGILGVEFQQLAIPAEWAVTFNADGSATVTAATEGGGE